MNSRNSPGSRPSLARLKNLSWSSLLLAAPLLTVGTSQSWAQIATSTSILSTSRGVPVVNPQPGQDIKLIAYVRSATEKHVTSGQVKFCDAAALLCEDTHLLGTSQLTAEGKASLHVLAQFGRHSYKAVFVGTTELSPSTSAPRLISTPRLRPTYSSTTTLSASGSAGTYILTVNVAGVQALNSDLPSGVIHFLDKFDYISEVGKAILPAGLPSANYTQAPIQPVFQSASGPLLADFNQDGRVDAAYCVQDHQPVISLGKSDGAFSALPPLSSQHKACLSAITGDFNDDGYIDILAGDLAGARLYYGKGDGAFQDPVDVTLTTDTVVVEGAADFNHDGNLDLVVFRAPSQFAYVLLGHGNGTFTPSWQSAEIEDGQFDGLAGFGDFNGDGKLDFVAYSSVDESYFISVFNGNGDGTFTATTYPSNFDDGSGRVIAGPDFNGDGRPDMVVPGYRREEDGGSITVLLTKPGGGFTARRMFLDQAPLRSAVGDFNGDGLADIWFVKEEASGRVEHALLGDGHGSFTDTVRNSLLTQPGQIYVDNATAADVNADGLSDLVMSYQLGSGSSSQPGLGSEITQLGRTVSATIKPPVGPGPHQVAARYFGDDDFEPSSSAPVPIAPLAGPAPVALFSTLAEDFGEQQVGEPSKAMTVLLTNGGSAPLKLSSVMVVPAPYKGKSFVTSNNCPASLAVSASCKIRVRFDPGSPGIKASTLVVVDNAANSPQSITLAGTGTVAP